MTMYLVESYSYSLTIFICFTPCYHVFFILTDTLINLLLIFHTFIIRLFLVHSSSPTVSVCMTTVTTRLVTADTSAVNHIKMPGPIQRSIRRQNIRFLHTKNQFFGEFVQFIRKLVGCNSVGPLPQHCKLVSPAPGGRWSEGCAGGTVVGGSEGSGVGALMWRSKMFSGCETKAMKPNLSFPGCKSLASSFLQYRL